VAAFFVAAIVGFVGVWGVKAFVWPLFFTEDTSGDSVSDVNNVDNNHNTIYINPGDTVTEDTVVNPSVNDDDQEEKDDENIVNNKDSSRESRANISSQDSPVPHPEREEGNETKEKLDSLRTVVDKPVNETPKPVEPKMSDSEFEQLLNNCDGRLLTSPDKVSKNIRFTVAGQKEGENRASTIEAIFDKLETNTWKRVQVVSTLHDNNGRITYATIRVVY
jgi:hypothetical protein